ncbi:uridine kinase [Brevundimonas sp.]|uniref:uridine kinase n=1 Tax=Brevundimonas sp. TaxID=1871086 RepID=UPI0025F67950|nr:uridine kinase [Brevundimonas sp.]
MAFLIGIVGGSGSGKTTIAQALARRLGGRAVLIAEDSYYGEYADEPWFDPATFDFDDVASRDHALMAGHLAELKAGGAVDVPHYDFVTHRRLPGEATATGPAEVVIVEGLHLFCTPEVAALFDLRVFVDTPADVRFIRRLIRDQAERGRTWESVVAQYLATVRPAHVRQIEPSRTGAEIVILDEAAAVRLEDPTSVDRLVAPILADPRMARLLD